MNAGRGKRPDRIGAIRQSPVIARQFQELVLAEIAFQQQRIAEFAGRKPLAHLDNSGLEAPFVSDAQLDTGLPHRRNRRLRIGHRRAQRLLAEHVTTRPCRCNDLFGVVLLRRTEDDGVDIWIGKRILEPQCRLDAKRRRRSARLI